MVVTAGMQELYVRDLLWLFRWYVRDVSYYLGVEWYWL